MRRLARGAHHQFPGIIGINADHLPRSRTDHVGSVVPPILDTTAHIEGSIEGKHAHSRLIQAAPIGSLINHLGPPAGLRTCRWRFPDLIPLVMIERPGVEVVVEDLQARIPHCLWDHQSQARRSAPTVLLRDRPTAG